jgi:hypothetical protein
MTGRGPGTDGSKGAVAAPSASPGADPEAAARAAAEIQFKSRVGDPNPPKPTEKAVAPPPPPVRKSGGGSRPAASKPNPFGGVTPPPPVAPPPVGSTPQNDPSDGAGAASSFRPSERRVSVKRAGDPGGSPGAAGSFDQSKFAAVINQHDHKVALRTCYERALKRDEKLKVGRLEVTVSVGETGIVKRVSVDAPSEFATVSSCIRETVRRWRFPSSGEEYEHIFPLILQGTAD